MSSAFPALLALLIAVPIAILITILVISIHIARLVHRVCIEQLQTTASAVAKAERLAGELDEMQRCHTQEVIDAEERGRASTEIVAAERLLSMIEFARSADRRKIS